MSKYLHVTTTGHGIGVRFTVLSLLCKIAAFSALTLLVGRQTWHLACKNSLFSNPVSFS